MSAESNTGSAPEPSERPRARRRSPRPSWQRQLAGQAATFVGAVAGAAATALAHTAERSARQGIIDWPLVERTAIWRVRNAPGALPRSELERVAPVYAAAMGEVVPALGKALDADLPGIVNRTAVVSRAEWVRANVATFARLMNTIEGDLIDQAVPPGAGFMKSTLAIFNRSVTSRQVAYLVGFLGQRVLGQYDLALLTAESSPGRLMFVDENIRHVAELLDVPVNPFRTWIALHESTHAFEFESHPWLRPYMSERLEAQLTSLSGTVSGMSGDAARRLARALRSAAAGESWMEGLMTLEQRRGFREIQAVMSVIEGFGDYVMDEVGADLVPEVEMISARFHARREQRTSFERAMMRVTGMDIKMDQYRKGEEFVARIVDQAGRDALRKLWEGPETMPTPEEIEDPGRWVARVMPGQAPAGSTGH